LDSKFYFVQDMISFTCVQNNCRIVPQYESEFITFVFETLIKPRSWDTCENPTQSCSF